MSIKLLIISLLTFSSTLAFAENHLLLMGGGGEPQGETTIFDSGMETFGKNLKSDKWNYEISFNGGHQKTEQMLRKSFKGPVRETTDFTAEQFEHLLTSYKERILNNQIKPGDQLMIIINSHGGSKGADSTTHKISAKGGEAVDLNNLQGSKLVNLDKLSEIVKLANDKGINLGIVDLSCHSGNTLALTKDAPNLCVVTATGPVHYGFAGPAAFIDRFFANLAPGTNLEEAFLKGRLEARDASYPMISTDINDEIVADVYDSITPYLYYYSPRTDKMTGYIVEAASANLTCKREEDFSNLISKIDKLSSVVKSKKNGFNADELKKLLNEYKTSQDKVIKASLALGSQNLSNIETFVVPHGITAPPGFKLQYTWKELLKYDVDKRIGEYENFARNSTNPRFKAENQAVANFLKTVKSKQLSIMAQYPKIKEFQEETRTLVKSMANTRSIADRISLQEKQFYEELYRRKQVSSAANPCQKIVF